MNGTVKNDTKLWRYGGKNHTVNFFPYRVLNSYVIRMFYYDWTHGNFCVSRLSLFVRQLHNGASSVIKIEGVL